MINLTDAILVIILLSVLLSLASNRLIVLVKIMALQGIVVSLTPLFILSSIAILAAAALFSFSDHDSD